MHDGFASAEDSHEMPPPTTTVQMTAPAERRPSTRNVEVTADEIPLRISVWDANVVLATDPPARKHRDGAAPSVAAHRSAVRCLADSAAADPGTVRGIGAATLKNLSSERSRGPAASYIFTPQTAASNALREPLSPRCHGTGTP